MDIVSAILSGIIYDVLKAGVKLTYESVFGNFYGKDMNVNNTLYSDFIDQINKKEQLDEKEQTVNNLLNDEEVIATLGKELYNTNFAKRLDYVMYLMNQRKTYYNTPRINLEYLGEWLGYNSVNELKRYYINNEEPEYSFLEVIAERLGVDQSWMKHGEDLRPFKAVDTQDAGYADRLVEVKDEGEYIFVLKKCNTRREMVVAKRVDDIKYIVYRTHYVFHSQVGATGAHQLYSVYQFLEEVVKRRKKELHNVYIVDEEVFNGLTMGKYYPGIVSNYKDVDYQDILCNFIKLDATETVKNEYIKMYGREFVEAQQIVKHQMRTDITY